MADYTVTTVADLITHQRITNPNSVYGSARTPAAGSLWAGVYVYHGFIEAAANTNPGSVYLQVRGEAVNDQWITVRQFTAFSGTPVTEALTATEAIGETVMAVASTTGFAADDYIYITDATSDTADEWHQLDVIVSNTSLNLVEGLVAAKASGDDAFSNAEQRFWRLSLAGVLEYRAIYKSEGATGANSAVWVRTVEVTDFE